VIHPDEGRERFDGTAERRGCDRADEFHVRRYGDLGICVEEDGGAGAGTQRDSIRFADCATDCHLLRVKNAGQGLAGVELVTFLRFALRVGAKYVLDGDHTG